VRRPLLALLCAGTALAQPGTVVYQGYLADAAGVPTSATVDLYFKIYTAQSGGTAIWEQDSSGVVVADGLFSVELVISESDLSQTDLWLGVAVNDESMEMDPRQRLAWVPWARVCGDALALGTVPAAQTQLRVTGTCSGGDTIRVVNADGTVACEPDDLGGAGAVTSLTAGMGLTNNQTTGSVVMDVAAGAGLTVASDTLAANLAGSGSLNTVARSDHAHGTAYFAAGGLGPCAVDDKVYAIDPALGDVYCSIDQRNTYFAGTNLQMLPGNLLDTQDDIFLAPGGAVIAGQFEFTGPRLAFYTVHPADFDTQDSGDTSYSNSAGSGSSPALVGVSISALIDLPDLVHISQVTVFFNEADAANELSCTLDVIDRVTGALTTPGGATTTCPGVPCGLTSSAIFPDVVVDNLAYAYVARCYLYATAAGGVTLYGYRVGYEVTEIRR